MLLLAEASGQLDEFLVPLGTTSAREGSFAEETLF
jgi:hypothetical protein